MKLNKEVCKSCLKKAELDLLKRKIWGWGRSDEKRWILKKVVFCPYVLKAHISLAGDSITSINKIPNECIYKLEHMVIK